MAVDYDGVLEEIGQLGPWQKRLFLLLWIPSAMSAMAVFMYDFTAFVPKHRCLVDLCDSESSCYDEPFVNFTIPWDDDLEGFSQCKMYNANSSSTKCESASFQTNPQVKSSCSAWVFDHSLISSSAVEDFEMVCSNKTKKNLTQTVYMVGMLIGSFVFGWMSDFCGRKSTLMVGLVILAVGGSFPFFLHPSPSNYYALVLSRYFLQLLID